MPITVSLAASWQGRYRPEEIAHLHEALLRDEALDAAEWGRTTPHDWEIVCLRIENYSVASLIQQADYNSPYALARRRTRCLLLS